MENITQNVTVVEEEEFDIREIHTFSCDLIIKEEFSANLILTE